MATVGKAASKGRPGASRGGSEPVFNIGYVVEQLQADFPDLSISKVRYLEDRGLLAPARSKGRYRKYTKADIRTLRTVLTLQRDEYLPLEVIRQRVQQSAVSGALGSPQARSASLSASLRREEPLYSAKEICETTGVGEPFLQDLEEYRLIERFPGSGTGYTDTDLEIVRVCHLLSRFQVEPRNLRLLSSSAEREAALVEQVATTALRSTHPDKKEYGQKLVEELGSLFSQLNHLLLYRELRRLL